MRQILGPISFCLLLQTSLSSAAKAAEPVHFLAGASPVWGQSTGSNLHLAHSVPVWHSPTPASSHTAAAGPSISRSQSLHASAVHNFGVLPTSVNFIAPSSAIVNSSSSQTASADLDLSSSTKSISAATFLPGGTVTIIVGNAKMVVTPQSQLTPAEAAAAYAMLTNGSQSLVINKNGVATGGTVVLGGGEAKEVDGLDIPKGVTVLDQFSSNQTLTLSDGLSNYGKLLLDPLGGGLTATISGSTILNAGSALLGGASGVGANRLSSVTLDATNGISNSGIISAPGTLQLNSNSLTNAGQISAVHNVTIQNLSGDALNIIGTGGSIRCGGTLTFNAVSSDGASPSLNIQDGKYTAPKIELNAGAGSLAVNVAQLNGGVSIVAGSSNVSVYNGSLNVVNANVSGDPDFSSSTNLTIQAVNTDGDSFVAVAGGNISCPGKGGTIDASNPNAPGGDITIAAGVTFNGDTGPSNITGASATGGSIQLSNVSLNSNDATITIIANAGSAKGSGSIVLNTINDSGNSQLVPNGGNITITAAGAITIQGISSAGYTPYFDSPTFPGTVGGNGGNVTITNSSTAATYIGYIGVGGGSGNAGADGSNANGGNGGNGGNGNPVGGFGAGGAAPGVLGSGPGANGTNGVQNSSPSNGTDGADGGDGEDGLAGSNGGSGGNITITTKGSLTVPYFLSASGGAGGSGGNGGISGGGGQGGNGGGGVNLTYPQPADGAAGMGGANGGNGADGGKGGDGGDGGKGGDSGNITISAGGSVKIKGIIASGGDGGDGGTGGNGNTGGGGGNAGQAGDGDPGVNNTGGQGGNGGDGAEGGSAGNGGNGGDGGDGGKGGDGGNGGTISIAAGGKSVFGTITATGGSGGSGSDGGTALYAYAGFAPSGQFGSTGGFGGLSSPSNSPGSNGNAGNGGDGGNGADGGNGGNGGDGGNGGNGGQLTLNITGSYTGASLTLHGGNAGSGGAGLDGGPATGGGAGGAGGYEYPATGNAGDGGQGGNGGNGGNGGDGGSGGEGGAGGALSIQKGSGSFTDQLSISAGLNGGGGPGGFGNVLGAAGAAGIAGTSSAGSGNPGEPGMAGQSGSDGSTGYSPITPNPPGMVSGSGGTASFAGAPAASAPGVVVMTEPSASTPTAPLTGGTRVNSTSDLPSYVSTFASSGGSSQSNGIMLLAPLTGSITANSIGTISSANTNAISFAGISDSQIAATSAAVGVLNSALNTCTSTNVQPLISAVSEGNFLTSDFGGDFVTTFGKVTVAKGVVAFISLHVSTLNVYNLTGAGSGVVYHPKQGQSISLTAGQHLVVSSNKASYDDLTRENGLAVRFVSPVELPGHSAYKADFALLTALRSMPFLAQKLTSSSATDKKVLNKVMLTCAILAQLDQRDTQFNFR